MDKECKGFLWTNLITETASGSETVNQKVWAEVRALALAPSQCVFISVCLPGIVA